MHRRPGAAREPVAGVDLEPNPRLPVGAERDRGYASDRQPGRAHRSALDQATDVAEGDAHGVAIVDGPAPYENHSRHGAHERRQDDQPTPHPNGSRGLAPQKISVPIAEMSVTPTMLIAIERAVASPTSAAPPSRNSKPW